MPGWNEPVATGTRSPIFSVAFCPSKARIWGFWMSLVLVSLNSAVALAGGMVTWKLVASRLANWFRLMVLAEPLLLLLFPVPVPPVPVLVLVLILGCRANVALVGGLMPRLRILSRLTC